VVGLTGKFLGACSRRPFAVPEMIRIMSLYLQEMVRGGLLKKFLERL